MKYVSQSEMNEFFGCPQEWLFRKTGKPTTPVDDTAMLFGRMMHNILALYYQKVPENPLPEEMEQALDEAYKDGLDPLFSARKKTIEKMLANFLSLEKRRLRSSEKYKPEFVETKFSHPPFVGIIDFYGDGIVIDWKSFGNVSSVSTAMIRQGKIYEWILKKNNHPVKMVRFFSLDTGEFIPCPRVTDEWLLKEYNRMMEMIERKEFTKIRGRQCDWCRYPLSCQFSGVSLWEENV